MKKSIQSVLFDLLNIHSKEQALELVSADSHSDAVKTQRAELIAYRLRFFALLFALLVPFWSIIEIIFLPAEIWQPLLLLRLVSGAAFYWIWKQTNHEIPSLSRSLRLLFFLLLIPVLFVLLANWWLPNTEISESQALLIELFSLLPYLVIAAISLFPLTVKEFQGYSFVLIVLGFLSMVQKETADIATTTTQVWLLLLLLGTSFFSSLNQMRDMISQVMRASYDELTKAMTRRAGIQTIEVLYKMSQLQQQPLSVLFADIDHFKNLNDTYGHAAGDQCLKEAANAIKNTIRSSDIVIRWGGEEFLVLMPNSNEVQAKEGIKRLYQNGFGENPDGEAVTFSMGLANSEKDHTNNWKDLVEKADQRLYAAKDTGRNRCIGYDNRVLFPD